MTDTATTTAEDAHGDRGHDEHAHDGGGHGSNRSGGHDHAAPRPAANPFDTLVQVTRPKLWISLAALGLLVVATLGWAFFGQVKTTVTGAGMLVPAGGFRTATAPAAGVVSAITSAAGTNVTQGQTVVTITTPTGTVNAIAPATGSLLQVDAVVGGPVAAGQELAVIAPTGAAPEVVGYVPVTTGKQVTVGQSVQVNSTADNAEGLQTFTGTVAAIGAVPVSGSQLAAGLGSSSAAAAIGAEGAVLTVTVSLDVDASTTSGLATSNAQGNDQPFVLGTVAQLQVTVDARRPINVVLGS